MMPLNFKWVTVGVANFAFTLVLSGSLHADPSACASVVMQDAPGEASEGESISHRYGYAGGSGNSTAQAKQDAANEAAAKCYADPRRATQNAEYAENKKACELAAIAGCQCHFEAAVDAKSCNITFTNYENDGSGGIRKCTVTVDPVTGRESPCKPSTIDANNPVPADVQKKLGDRRVKGTWQAKAEGYYDITGYSCSAKGQCEESVEGGQGGEGGEPGIFSPGQF